jgi:hypothetical protein
VTDVRREPAGTAPATPSLSVCCEFPRTASPRRTERVLLVP